MQPAAHGREQLLGVNRLGKILRGPRLEALLAIALHRFGRQRDDRQTVRKAGFSRIAPIVWYPSISGIMISIRTMATSGVDRTSSIASPPVVAASTLMPRRSSTLRKREDVARIVIDEERRLANQILVGAI